MYAGAVTVAASLVAGCGTINLDNLLAIIDPNGQPLEITKCTGPPYSYTAFSGFRESAQIQEDAFVAWRDAPENLRDNSVVRAILSQAEIIPLKVPPVVLAYSQRPALAPTPVKIPSPVLSLGHTDFYAFAKLVSEYAIRQPTGSNLFLQALTKYYQAYYAGPFYTYFGAKFDKPVASLTVNDNEITQSAGVFIDLLFDYAMKSPVWVDGGTYYPGSGTNKPTVAKLSEEGFQYQGFPQPVKLPVLLPNGCHMTVTKAKIINYVAQQFATAASSDTSLTIRSVGGWGISFGIFGKLSVGDNNTLSLLAKATVSEATLRLTAQLVYYALSQVDIKESRNLTLDQKTALVQNVSSLFISPNR
jgi:hypothetical protein